MPRSPLSLVAALGLAAGLALVPAAPGFAAPSAGAAKAYANCTAINKVWSGGIAKVGVTKNRTPSGSRALKGTVKHSNALYAANTKSDRDKDGVACEKS